MSFASAQAGAQHSQSPVDTDRGGDATVMRQCTADHWSILLTFQKNSEDDLRIRDRSDSNWNDCLQLRTRGLFGTRAVLEVLLLLHHANHRRTGIDHIEFTCRCTAQVDDSAPTIRTTVCDANQDRLAVVMVSDQHPGAKRQRAVGGGKSVGAGDLAACRASAAVERGATRFSVNWRDGYRHQNDGKRKFEGNH